MFKELIKKIEKNKYFYLFLFFSIFLGIFLRIYVFLQQYSLEGDECSLAINILKQKTFHELIFTPLYWFNQAAPVGFMVISKCFSNIWGINESALRIFPLLSGIFSIFLFYFFAKDYLSSKSLLFSVFIFAVSGSLVSYSVFFKPYSVDVMAILIIFIMAKYFLNKEIISMFIPSLLGLLLVWLSYPVVFVLASVGIYYGFVYFYKKQKINLLRLSTVCYIWLVSFLISSVFAYSNFLRSKDYFLWYWKDYFMPVPPDWNWFLLALSQLCNTTFQSVFHSSILMYLLIITGAGLCIFQKKEKSVLLVLPIIFTLAASCIKAYPFGDRLILFLAPIVIIFVAKNLEYLNYFDKFIKNNIIKNGLVLLISAIILFQIPFNTKNYFHIRTNIKINDFLVFIGQNMEKTDYIYLTPYDKGYFIIDNELHNRNEKLYYGDKKIYSVDKKSLDYFKKDIETLKTQKTRIWFPFFATYNSKDYDRITFEQTIAFKKYLESQKDLKLIKYMKDEKKGGEVYLYQTIK